MNRGIHIYWKIPPPRGGGDISRCHLDEKIGKGEERKRKKVGKKKRKWEVKE
jgi:hypothetical protein